MLKHYFQSLGTNGGTPPPTPIRLTVGYTDAVTPGSACGLSQFVYVVSPVSEINTGVQVWLNSSLTIKLLGQTYITDTAGNIFNIDSATGIVGASTFLTC